MADGKNIKLCPACEEATKKAGLTTEGIGMIGIKKELLVLLCKQCQEMTEKYSED